MPSTPKQPSCTAPRKDGRPCTAPALPGSAYCFAHDPSRAAAQAEARRKGGRNRARVVRLRAMAPPRLVAVFDVLERALEQVRDGELDPKRAQAMAALASAMVRTLTAGELEQRVRALETGGDRAAG